MKLFANQTVEALHNYDLCKILLFKLVKQVEWIYGLISSFVILRKKGDHKKENSKYDVNIMLDKKFECKCMY